MISNYVRYLQCHHNITAAHHASESAIRSIDQATTIKIYKQNIWKLVDIEKYLPNDPVQRMHYIQGLPHAFPFKIEEYRFNSENNVFNAISIWKIEEQADKDKVMQKNTWIVTKIAS
ncbi:hypothetical protein GLOIN_2v1782174 [Rhizophagus clarus]|uniref:Uncharacterized protein n=1 Tax=Rhizophagus clarus TaxID=94130 RepID=A0A8H3M929_9GLOM|nr:hypothetical protein GLOIN_2v1782174 [Rhizophagus clarus]